MRVPDELGFYGILSDPVVGYERLADIMVERDIRVIQLRMKNAPADAVLRTAHAVRCVIPPQTAFIVNDDPRIARDAGADGVHLGRTDMPYPEARAIVGPEAVVGLSTHTVEQVRAACELAPDYIGVGPVFPTTTKDVADRVLGPDGLRRMLAAATVPAVAIGGITPGNLPQVLRAGARNACSVHAVNAADDPGAVIDRIRCTFAGKTAGA